MALFDSPFGVVVLVRRPFTVAVERILLARPLHLDHDLFAVGVDLVIVAVGLPAVGNHLQAHRVANGDHVDGHLAVFIALKLQRALVLIPFHGMEDDSGVGDGLTIGRPQYRDFDGGGCRRRGVFAPVTLIRTRHKATENPPSNSTTLEILRENEPMAESIDDFIRVAGVHSRRNI